MGNHMIHMGTITCIKLILQKQSSIYQNDKELYLNANEVHDLKWKIRKSEGQILWEDHNFENISVTSKQSGILFFKFLWLSEL